MPDSIEEFLLGLKDADFLSMKLFCEVLMDFQTDEFGKRIVENIGLLSKFDISFLKADDLYCYADVSKDKVEYALTYYASKFDACHEFGHLLVGLFAKGEVPDNYHKVNDECQIKLCKMSDRIISLLANYKEYIFPIIMDGAQEAGCFFERHPNLKEVL